MICFDDQIALPISRGVAIEWRCKGDGIRVLPRDSKLTTMCFCARRSQVGKRFAGSEYGVEPRDMIGFRSRVPGRDVTAYRANRYTSTTLAELSGVFGLLTPRQFGSLFKRTRRTQEEYAIGDVTGPWFG